MADDEIPLAKQKVSGKELAAVLGITPRYVRMIVKAGHITAVDEATYILGDAVQGFVRYQKEQAKDDSPEKAEAARLKKEQADRLAMENEIRRRNVVRVDEVRQVLGPVFIALRQALLAIPTRVSALIATSDSEKDIHKRLDTEIRQTLEELNIDELLDQEPEERGRGRPNTASR